MKTTCIPAVVDEATRLTTADHRTSPRVIGDLLTRNAPQGQLAPAELAPLLDQLLVNEPIHYASVLDAIPLLRTWLPASGADADYALLIDDNAIIGFVWLNSKSYETAMNVDARLLMGAVLSHNIDRVILATTWSIQDSGFNDERTSDIDSVGEALALFGVSLLDWLHIHPGHTESYMQAAFGEESIDLTEDQVTYCYDHCTFADQTEIEQVDDDE